MLGLKSQVLISLVEWTEICFVSTGVDDDERAMYPTSNKSEQQKMDGFAHDRMYSTYCPKDIATTTVMYSK